MLHKINIFLAVAFAMFLSGCATMKPVFHVVVDSIKSDTAPVGTKGIILPRG